MAQEMLAEVERLNVAVEKVMGSGDVWRADGPDGPGEVALWMLPTEPGKEGLHIVIGTARLVTRGLVVVERHVEPVLSPGHMPGPHEHRVAHCSAHTLDTGRDKLRRSDFYGQDEPVDALTSPDVVRRLVALQDPIAAINLCSAEPPSDVRDVLQRMGAGSVFENSYLTSALQYSLTGGPAATPQ